MTKEEISGVVNEGGRRRMKKRSVGGKYQAEEECQCWSVPGDGTNLTSGRGDNTEERRKKSDGDEKGENNSSAPEQWLREIGLGLVEARLRSPSSTGLDMATRIVALRKGQKNGKLSTLRIQIIMSTGLCLISLLLWSFCLACSMYVSVLRRCLICTERVLRRCLYSVWWLPSVMTIQLPGLYKKAPKCFSGA